MDEICVCEKPAFTLRELEAQITELAGHLNAAHYRWLCLIAEFDRRHGWANGATPFCAHWLNLAMRDRSRGRARESPCGARLGKTSKDRRCHGVWGAELLQGAGIDARRLRADVRAFTQYRLARYGRSCREARPAVPTRAGSGRTLPGGPASALRFSGKASTRH